MSWLNLSLRGKGLVVVAIPLLALAMVILAFSSVGRQAERAAYWVRHTYQVGNEIQQVSMLLYAAESAVRAYRLNPKQEFLQAYRETGKTLPGTLDRIAKLVQDNPPQIQRLQQVRFLVRQRMQILETMEQKPQNVPVSEIRQSMAAGKTVMDQLLSQLQAMQGEESLLLSQRMAKEEQAQGRMDVTIGVSALVGLIGGLLAALLFTTGVVRRLRRLEQNSRRLIERQPLHPFPSSADEIGQLGQELEVASGILAERERELRDNQRRLQALFDNTQDAILLADDEGHYMGVNPAASILTGYPAAELLQQTVWDLTPAPSREIGAELWQTFIASGQQSGEYTLTRKDQRTVEVEYRAVANIEPGLHLAALRDVTERKQIEVAARYAMREAERASQSKSEFLSRMSHELRTPLNAILGFAQVLEMGQITPRQQEAVTHILKAGNHLLALINEVLDISRIEAGQLTLSLEPVSPRELLEEALSLVRPLAAHRRISLDNEFQGCEAYVLADRQRLKQVLLNLLSNAIKYNRDDGRVILSCEPTNDNLLRILVRDTGPGIPADKMQRLFTVFDRLGAEQTGVEGTGIGLALSKRLIEAMGGTIQVTSKTGQGSTFWVELPLVASPLALLNVPSSTLDPTSISQLITASVQPLSRTVLYVEDNLPNLELVETILTHRPVVRLLSAMQGRMGLELAREHQPDLILLDLHLPDLAGDEVLRQLQMEPRTQNIPVVIISADATPGQIERLLAAGVVTYLTKPLDVKRLLALIDEHLSAAPP